MLSFMPRKHLRMKWNTWTRRPARYSSLANVTITARALHNNTVCPSEARWSETKSLKPQTSSFSFWPGGSSGSASLGAWRRSEAPLCVSWSGACFSHSAGAVGGGRRDWHAKSWTASKMAPESHSSGASGKPGCSTGPLWTHCSFIIGPMNAMRSREIIIPKK